MAYPLKIERKSVTILFTDIVGFTKTMSTNEEYAYELIDKKRQLLLPLINKKDGKLVKEIGDGTLSRYSSTVNAINCATDFLGKLTKIENLEVRAGIHYGEVIQEKQDVFGNVVNIASRIENLAKPGSLFVSKEAIDQIESDVDLEFVSLGLQSLKGVGRLVEVFAINAHNLIVPSLEDYKETSVHAHSGEEVPSIAVIPFENKGSDEDIFYAYGISADLVSDLSSAGTIRVASIKNIENIKNYNDLGLEECAAKLFVRYIATGTLWKMGDLFQLSIELYDTKHSCIVWSDRWQEQWENLISIKVNLADGLLKSLASEQKVNLKPETLNSQAYEFYLKGKYKYEKRRNREDLEISRQLLNKALEIDENLISAKIVLGNTYNESGNYDKALALYDSARKSAEFFNDKLGIATAINNIGNIHLLKGQYNKAEEMYNSSMDLRQIVGDKLGIGSSLNNLGNLQRRKGNFIKALDYYKNSLQIFEKLDDKSDIATTLNNVGVMQRLSNDYKGSLKSYEKAFKIRKELDDQNGMALLLNNIGNVYSMQNNLMEALKNYHYSLDVVSKTGNKMVIANTLNNMANIHFSMANYEKALNIYNESLELRKKLSDKNGIASSFINIGIIFSIFGQYNKAIECFTHSKDIRENLNDKNGLYNALKNIGILSIRIKNYDSAMKSLKLSYEIQLDLDHSDSQLAETQIRILLIKKMLGEKLKKREINKIINQLTEPDYGLQYDIYLLNGEVKYLRKAYEILKYQADQLKLEDKTKFFSYPFNKCVLEEYEKIS